MATFAAPLRKALGSMAVSSPASSDYYPMSSLSLWYGTAPFSEVVEPLNLRRMGLLSHSSFQRSGVHLTGPRFLTSKTRLALDRLGAANAWSHSARLTTTRMRQKISLPVGVKKKMVLRMSATGRGNVRAMKGLRLWLVVRALIVDELDRHSQHVLARY